MYREIETLISSLAARVPSGGGRPGGYLPVRTPWASGDQTICEIPCSAQKRDELRLGRPPDHVVLRLRGDELLRRRRRRGPPGSAPTVHSENPISRTLPASHDLGQRLHRLLDRRLRVGAVALVEVDVVGPQPVERGVELLVDLLAREPAVGLGHREVDLGGEDVVLADEVREDLAPGRLGGPHAVDVGGVEEVDPGVERGAGAGLGVLALDPGPVCEPGAQRDLRDLDPRLAEAPVPRLYARWSVAASGSLAASISSRTSSSRPARISSTGSGSPLTIPSKNSLRSW